MSSFFNLITQRLDDITKFDTPLFLLFLITGVLLYYILHRPKIILFILSFLFYASFSLELSIFVLMLSTINYLLGIALYKYHSRFLLTVSILINIGSLIYFKYLNFILLNLNKIKLFGEFDIFSNILLPIGISFFIFEFIHYLVDVYKRNKPVTKLLDFYIFTLFFPTQIAGPIKRYENFIPQLRKKKTDFPLIAQGIDLIILGLFKKLVLANSLSLIFTRYFTDVYTTQNPFTIILGIYAFCFQIYFDFSGYTDIGRGSAALFNIRVPINFLNPYLSKSIPEFWKRWHITLMDWLRDYLYIPLGGSRKGELKRIVNIIIVFIASGLWHGAAYHFIFWGLYNALLMITSIYFAPSRLINFLPHKIKDIICWSITFNLITFGWILFRIPSIYDLTLIFKNIITVAPVVNINRDVLFIAMLLFIYLITRVLFRYIKSYKRIYIFAKYTSYAIALILIVLNMNISITPFIYFQF